MPILTDTERKILRILFNRYRLDQTHADIDLLSRLSGRSPDRVQQALHGLAAKGHITYELPLVQVLLPWPDSPDPPKRDPSIWRE